MTTLTQAPEDTNALLKKVRENLAGYDSEMERVDAELDWLESQQPLQETVEEMSARLNAELFAD